MALLLIAAEGEDRIHHERALHGDEGAQARVAALELLTDQTVGDVVQTGAAVLLGEVGAEHTELAELGRDLVRKRARLEVLHHEREVALAYPAPHGVAHHALVLRELALELEEIDLAVGLHAGSPS